MVLLCAGIEPIEENVERGIVISDISGPLSAALPLGWRAVLFAEGQGFGKEQMYLDHRAIAGSAEGHGRRSWLLRNNGAAGRQKVRPNETDLI